MKYLNALFLLLCSIVFFKHNLAAQRLGFNLAHGSKKVNIPFEMHNNLIVIPVVLNKRLPLKFVLDTGVRTAILTEKAFSDILNLSYNKKIKISGAGGENLIEVYITNNISLELPGVDSRGHAMVVLDKDYLQLSNSLGTDVHGILGYELFSRFVVKVNFERKVLTLYEPSSFKPKKKFTQIPIVVEDTKPYFKVDFDFFNGESMNCKLLIDTGASHSLLLESNESTSIKVPEKTIDGFLGRGLAGDITGKIGRVPMMKMGNYEFNNVITSFPDPHSYADSLLTGSTFRHGTIGGGIISRFNIIFDFPREKIYLKKNSGFKKPFDYNLSGMSVLATGDNLGIYKINVVRKGSPADLAGLKTGDIIQKINSIDTNNLTLNHVYGYFNSKNNRKVRLQIIRDGKVMRTNVTLKSQI